MKKNNKKLRNYSKPGPANCVKSFGLFFLICVCFMGCNLKKKSEKSAIPIASKLSGKELAQSYCSSCHQFPEPSLLDKKTWKNGVLPKMSDRLGLNDDYFTLFYELDNDEMQTIIAAGIYPESPVIAKEDWAKIVKYYLDNAPEKPLIQEKKLRPQLGLAGFKLNYLLAKKNKFSTATLVKFEPSKKNIWLAFRDNQSYLKKFDLAFNLLDSIAIDSPASDIIFEKNGLGILTMGKMDPNDNKKGKFSFFDFKTKTFKNIADSLQRPTNISKVDLNNDKVDDYLICNFGNELGKLTWLDGKSGQENIINNQPGARNTVIKDLNGDKLPDILVLMTQAKEQIILYTNLGNGKFSEKTLLSFPPVYGSSYFEMVDFNKDGFQDILYTNGDNADLTISLKKYHGIRIFMNDGKNNFKQSYFYPMHGAAKAMAADFDLDGDLDIAAISFFTDPNQKPNEGFLYFQNNGDNLNFTISTIKEASAGKWMVMDLADMDLDGDMDIIIGSFTLKSLQGESKSNSQKNIETLVFENTQIKK